MRPLAVVGLIAVIAISVGLVVFRLLPSDNPPSGAPGGYTPPTLDELKGHAAQLGTKGAPKADAGKVPLTFTDKDGKPVNLADYHGQKSVVLVVVKGLPKENNPFNPAVGRAFCPGCLAQINALVANYDEFKARRAEIVLVFPGPKDTLPLFLSDAKVDGKEPNPNVPFPLVSDADLKAVKELGIGGDLATPSTYILDTRGKVVFAYVAGSDTTYDRPSVKALLEKLDTLK